MPIQTQILQYALMRMWLSTDEETGEISATTIVWAAALVLLAIAVSTIVYDKVKAKADGISL